jgi:tetratricopeptide (TPR) repeat protein
MKNIWKISCCFAVLLLFTACVTQKKKGQDVGWFKKGYHNLTSKYNYWFNADELFSLTIDKLEASHKDNYSQILEIYPSEAADPNTAKSDFENVISKAARGIGLHRPSNYVEDCYTLIGQAQFMKRDYETAENTFKYIRDEYDPKKVSKSKIKSAKKKKSSVKKTSKKKSAKKKKKAAKKKKKAAAKKKKAAAKNKKSGSSKKSDDKTKTEAPKTETPAPKAATPDLELAGENPYKKSLQRTSAFPLAMIWFGRTLIARENYDEAEFLFRSLWEDPWFPAKLRDELYTAEANMWIKQKRYERAIEPLSKAIELTPRKKDRARLAFILAQLSERSGNYEKAYAAYTTVLKSHPGYEMEFNARLHQIESAWANNKMSSAEANKSLEKMTKDDKNLELKDQIYFTMAQIALKDGLKKDAIALLQKSLQFNKGNTPQRSESYITLADLYFELEDFVPAKNYYDSTLTVLPNTDARFKRVTDYAANLKDIARLIQTIAANDSIVRIFRMDDTERKEFAKVLKKQRDQEAAAAEKAAAISAANKAAAGPAKAPTPQAGNKASTFYFYNEAFLKKGKKDFNRSWGDRKLEDNWRRRNRPQAGNNGEDIAASDSTKNNGVSDTELNDLFKSIPKNEAELAVVHMSTYEAMYQLGTLFRDKLQNNKRCTGTLEEQQTRYPDTLKYQKETWYYCYLAFTDLRNTQRAAFYYDKLTGKYPNSPHARALSDPNFTNANKEREKELNRYYEETYGAFTKGQYKDAFDRCLDAPKKYGSQNQLMAKFSLLSALCVGNLQGNEAYCKALGEVIARYPESAEATRAREIARVMSCKGFEVGEAPKNNSDAAKIDDAFTREDDKLHYVLVAITGDVRTDDIKIAISDYNKENHKMDQLRISNIFLGTDTNLPILVIRKFDSKAKAMLYYNEVKDKKDFLGENNKKTYNKEIMAITQENYRRILKNKTLDGYREFFTENYLK